MNLSKLKPCLVAVGLAFVLITVVYGALWLYKREHDNMGEQAIHRMIPLLEEYRLRKGSYPERIELPRPGDQAGTTIPRFLLSPELHYDIVKGGYRLRFHQFPLGPFNGYDSRSREWFSEE